VETSAAGYLVLVEAYDPGWTASVDGEPVRVHRANYAFRAVAVPQGRHTVRLRYRPRPVVLGSVASVVTLAAAVVWFARLRAGDLRPAARRGSSQPPTVGARRRRPGLPGA
jgi:uncharacterized membrane protein YfhO